MSEGSPKFIPCPALSALGSWVFPMFPGSSLHSCIFTPLSQACCSQARQTSGICREETQQLNWAVRALPHPISPHQSPHPSPYASHDLCKGSQSIQKSMHSEQHREVGPKRAPPGIEPGAHAIVGDEFSLMPQLQSERVARPDDIVVGRVRPKHVFYH